MQETARQADEKSPGSRGSLRGIVATVMRLSYRQIVIGALVLAGTNALVFFVARPERQVRRDRRAETDDEQERPARSPPHAWAPPRWSAGAPEGSEGRAPENPAERPATDKPAPPEPPPVVWQPPPPIRSTEDLSAYLVQLTATARKNGVATADLVEPGFDAIRSLAPTMNPETVERMKHQFSDEMLAISKQR